MKVIIAGSRGITSFEAIERAVCDSGFEITEVVSGVARGVDKLGEHYAKKHGIPVKPSPALWHQHGKSAGYIRNVDMADYADALIAIWDGESRGTKHMIQAATDKGLLVYISTVGANE